MWACDFIDWKAASKVYYPSKIDQISGYAMFHGYSSSSIGVIRGDKLYNIKYVY